MAFKFNRFTGKLDIDVGATAGIGATGATGPSGGPVGAIGATALTNMMQITLAVYNALGAGINSNTVYIIVG